MIGACHEARLMETRDPSEMAPKIEPDRTPAKLTLDSVGHTPPVTSTHETTAQSATVRLYTSFAT